MSKFDKKYSELVDKIYHEGYEYEDPNRKGVMRKQIDHYVIEHDFKDGFPILSLKKTYWDLALQEMFLFTSGETDIREFWKAGVNFWDKDWTNFLVKKYSGAEEDKVRNFAKGFKEGFRKGKDYTGHDLEFSLGKIYSEQMRNFAGEVDQIEDLIKTLNTNPMATKKTVTMWNPADSDMQALTPCHYMWQALVSPLSSEQRWALVERDQPEGYMDIRTSEKKDYMNNLGIPKHGLRIKFSMHSVDTFLGLPINLCYYGELCEVLGQFVGMEPLGVVADLSNVHLYDNTYEEVEELLSRCVDVHPESYLKIPKADKSNGFDNYLKDLKSKSKEFKMENYTSYPPLKVEMLAYSK